MGEGTQRGWFDTRPPGGGIGFMAGCLVIFPLVLIFFGDDHWVRTGIAPALLAIGMGLWLKHSWARWLAFTFFAFVSVMSIALLVFDDFSGRKVIRAIVALSTLYALWEWDVWPADASSLAYDEVEDDEDFEEDLEEDLGEEDELEPQWDDDPPPRPSPWTMRT